MKLRLILAVFLLGLCIPSIGCSSGPDKAQGETNTSGQSSDRISEVTKMSGGYSSYLAYDASDNKGYQLTWLSTEDKLERYLREIYQHSPSLNGNKQYDTAAFDISKFDYVAVVSPRKSSGVKYLLSSAVLDGKGTLSITIQETKPDVQTVDIMRELQIYKVPKGFAIQKVELKQVQSLKRNPTH